MKNVGPASLFKSLLWSFFLCSQKKEELLLSTQLQPTNKEVYGEHYNEQNLMTSLSFKFKLFSTC
jgi:hypothetical protein